jgi:hypothetical protein
MITFLTLGPAGSNHHLVLGRYLAAHRLEGVTAVVLADDFHQGARALIEGRADYMLQCAAHPDLADITGAYRKQVSVVDAFVSPSRPMALLRSRMSSRDAHGKVGVQPATRRYADLSGWPTTVFEPTVAAVGEGLLQGRYEAGIAFASLAEEHPHLLKVEEAIGAVSDAWVVFGRQPIDQGRAIVWEDSPVAARYRAEASGSVGTTAT